MGRMRGKGGRRAARYANRIVVAAGLAITGRAKRARRFDGSRVGRGAGIGRLLSSRDRLAGFRSRRVVIKTRLVRLGGHGMSAARAHLRYIQRDGVTREGAPGQLYGRDVDQADGKAFLERCAPDRHQFRFIVSAEDADQYPDLKPFVRRLMAQVEQDLGTKLDWVAVDHFNTGHPHTHIALRGVDDRGQNLVIAREYIAHGFRERAADLVTLDLGPRTQREIEARLRHDVGQERLTAIDRRLLARMAGDRSIACRANDPFFHALEAGRLQVLGRMDLAENLGSGRWRLAAGLEQTLRDMGERGDIIRLMQREMTRARLVRDQRIFDGEAVPVIGRVIVRGLADEHRDRHYLLIDGIDGRGHYVDIGKPASVEFLPEGTIVKVAPRSAAIREADRTIARIAAANAGRYSVAFHLKADPHASQAFATTHVRRLEAMRGAGVAVTREADGSWKLSEDHLREAEKFEQRALRDRPVDVTLLASQPLHQLATSEGATWLDRELAAAAPDGSRDAGFGAEFRQALDLRRKWLVEQQLADIGTSGFRMRPRTLTLLDRRELVAAAEVLSSALGKSFSEARPGVRIHGRLTRHVDLGSGRFAVLEAAHEFSLVPWRPALRKHLGKAGSGILRNSGFDWQPGRARAGPQID